MRATPRMPSRTGLALTTAVAAVTGIRAALRVRSKVQWIDPWTLLGGGNGVGSLTVPLT